MMCVATTFLVLNGDLVGQKNYCQACYSCNTGPTMSKLFKDFGFSATSLKIQPSILQISLCKSKFSKG